MKLEIQKLKAPLYQNFEFWKVIIPAVAIIATLIFTIQSGVVNVERARNELYKANLDLQVLRVKEHRDSLLAYVESVQNSADSISAILQERYDSAQQQIDSLVAARSTLLKQVSLLKNSRDLSDRELAIIRDEAERDKRQAKIKIEKLEGELAAVEPIRGVLIRYSDGTEKKYRNVDDAIAKIVSLVTLTRKSVVIEDVDYHLSKRDIREESFRQRLIDLGLKKTYIKQPGGTLSLHNRIESGEAKALSSDNVDLIIWVNDRYAKRE